MAKGFAETDRQCAETVADVKAGKFAPVYLLMGEEPYYVDMVCDAVVENAFSDDGERDFNQAIFYGADVDADMVVTEARRYPMFAERHLVVIREAQMMRSLEELAVYCAKPLESTVLVIAMHGASADKRKSLYKTVSKIGVVLESSMLRDYEMPQWINSYFRSRGLQITPEAASLLAEYAGTDLSKIAVETDKMLKNLPEGVTGVSPEDIEMNVGISRQYNIFELTRELSARNAAKALKIASFLGSAAQFRLASVTGQLFTHFYRILKYNALLMSNPGAGSDVKVRLLGVNPYFLREYDMAVRNYPVRKCMAAVALIRDYDFKGKGGETGEATDAELLSELTVRLLNL